MRRQEFFRRDDQRGRLSQKEQSCGRGAALRSHQKKKLLTALLPSIASKGAASLGARSGVWRQTV